MSSGEDPVRVSENQEPLSTPQPTLGVPTLTPSPAQEAPGLWASTVAPEPNSVEAAGGLEAMQTLASPPPRKRGRFQGLNGRHFQYQDPHEGQEGVQDAPAPEAAGNHVEPPRATGSTSQGGWSEGPWAVLTNEVEDPGTGKPGHPWAQELSPWELCPLPCPAPQWSPLWGKI